MKVSYNLLNTFFDGKLPSPEAVGEALTFHAWELEEIVPMEGDTQIDIKVLPDKSSWALSHRGIAKDLSVVLGIPLSSDPFATIPFLTPLLPDLSISIETSTCDRYSAALIENVVVGPSPLWLVAALHTLGQRSINNIVDITNYVMFMTGQPLHAFDAGKLGGQNIVVRDAEVGETITTLTGETYTLAKSDALIVDGKNNTPVGIAGIKGGKVAEVDTATQSILLEAAHFDAVRVRKTAQRLRLRTDASQRYENGIVAETTQYALVEAVRLIGELAEGTLVGYADTGVPPRTIDPVSVSIAKIERVLGTSFSEETIADIMERFGYDYTESNGVLTVTPPFERTDITIPEDLIEEIGRINGYDKVEAVTPSPVPLPEINKRFFYAEHVRDALVRLGFSEIYTSSFRKKDKVKLQNALASDKEYLRSTLRENMSEALQRNIPHKDLLGIPFVGVFEFGTVFTEAGEKYMLALGVQHAFEYKEKTDLPILTSALSAIGSLLGTELKWSSEGGVREIDFGSLLESLPSPSTYEKRESPERITFLPYSLYPAMSRDIAFWVPEGTDVSGIEELLASHAGALCVRITLFDTFTKEGRTSHAFRLVFQSNEKTLTDEEVNVYMDSVYAAVAAAGFEVR